MDKNTKASGGAVSMMKKIVLFFLKAIYIIPFFILGFWLISVVYFPGFDLNASISLLKYKKTPDTTQVTVQKKKEIPRDHFHMTDDYVTKLDEKRQVCNTCHDTYAHAKEPKVRALLNMHGGFMACTVCHVRRDGGEGQGGTVLEKKIGDFVWVDETTGEFKATVEGEYGKFPAMIFPVITAGTIYAPITEEEARSFLAVKPGLAQKELDEARKKLHGSVSKVAITCSDCHKKDGYLNFAKLGFSKQRVDNLISTEFIGTIETDKTFYLPSVIDFRGE